MANDIRKPRVGDHVAAIGQDGTFAVTAVNEFGRTADLEAMPSGKLLTRVPLTALSYGIVEYKKSRGDFKQGT